MDGWYQWTFFTQSAECHVNPGNNMPNRQFTGYSRSILLVLEHLLVVPYFWTWSIHYQFLISRSPYLLVSSSLYLGLAGTSHNSPTGLNRRKKKKSWLWEVYTLSLNVNVPLLRLSILIWLTEFLLRRTSPWGADSAGGCAAPRLGRHHGEEISGQRRQRTVKS